LHRTEGVRIVLAALLAIHGSIHVLGFLKPWKLAKVEQLSGRAIVSLSEGASKVVGLAWLAAALLLLAAAAFRVAERETWWILGAAGIALSQALIVLQWSDAKAGTVANLLLLLPVVVGAATARFHHANDEHARALLARASAWPPAVVGAADVAALPPPVRRWLEGCGAVGQPRARTVRLRQRGEMRTGPGKPFMHAEAKQYFTVDEPGFVWTVEVTMMGVVPVVGRDSYVDGRGRMFIQAGGLVTVADGTGAKFDQGTLLRYLAEISWFPSGALAPYITWEPIDESRARATMFSGGIAASAVFAFDDHGRLTQMTAKRYFGGQTLEDWVIPVTEWKMIRGIEMPVRGSAIWKLPAGDFEYYRWEILDVEVNRREVW
jgi:hypothetical protein